MATIKPFKGILYDSGKAGRMEGVVSPPYDIISPLMQDELHKRSPYNIVRLILAKDDKDNKYKRAARIFRDWQKRGVLKADKSPSIYAYVQEYLHKGKKIKRTGFIALMRLEDPKKSKVLPHEHTLAKPKEDRLNLLKEVKANLSPIFSLYQDPKGVISKKIKDFIKKYPPIVDLEFEGVTNRLWRIDNRSIIRFIQREMEPKKVFIADGHHRYEVSLAYRNMMKGKSGFKAGSNYVMMYFTNLSETVGVTILSTHRLVKEAGSLDIRGMLERLKPDFEITACGGIGALMAVLDEKKRNGRVFGMYGGGDFYALKLNDARALDSLSSENRSRHWKRLDVTILHNLIMDKLLGLKMTEDNIKYVREPQDGVKLVDNGEYKLAFFLNPTKITQLKNMALKGDMMPQKSTYFYPKLLTGLVINKF